MNERQEIDDAASVIREALEAATMLRAGSPKTLIDDACIALASLRSQLEEANEQNGEYAALRGELATLFGPATPHHGMSWAASMLAQITAQLQQAERERDEAREALWAFIDPQTKEWGYPAYALGRAYFEKYTRTALSTTPSPDPESTSGKETPAATLPQTDTRPSPEDAKE